MPQQIVKDPKIRLKTQSLVRTHARHLDKDDPTVEAAISGLYSSPEAMHLLNQRHVRENARRMQAIFSEPKALLDFVQRAPREVIVVKPERSGKGREQLVPITDTDRREITEAMVRQSVACHSTD